MFYTLYYPYPCPLDKNGSPIYPGDNIIYSGEEFLAIAISSPTTVIVAPKGEENKEVMLKELPSAECELAQKKIGDILESVYRLGADGVELSDEKEQLIIAEYFREVEIAANQITQRQEIANGELLRLLKETADEIDEIKAQLDKE